MTYCQTFVKKGCLVIQKLGRTKKSIKVGEISGEYDILTVRDKLVTLIGNKARKRIEIYQRKG